MPVISKLLLIVLDKLIRSINPLKVPWMIMGGVATSVWGEPRATYDLDFSINLDETQIQPLLSILKKHKLQPVQKNIMRVIHNLSYITLLYKSKGTKIYVDLFLAKTEYQQEAIARRRSIIFQRRKLFVISPEDLVLYKLLSGRGRDMDDVREILTTKKQDLDITYLKKWAMRLGVYTLLEDELIALNPGKR